MKSGANPTFLLLLRTHFLKHFITSSGEGNSYLVGGNTELYIKEAWISLSTASHGLTVRDAAAAPPPSSTKGSWRCTFRQPLEGPNSTEDSKSTFIREQPFPRLDVPTMYADRRRQPYPGLLRPGPS